MKILFVDDDAQVLHGLERALDLAEMEWETYFMRSGADALRFLETTPVDAIVTDMRMPHMDGAALLQEVADRFPGIVRVVLSGQATRDSVLRAVNPMHQYLSKPCDVQTLSRTLRKSLALRDMLRAPELTELIGKISSLPPAPMVYEQIMAELNSEKATASTIGEIVSRDPAMTAKILHIVNSAIFGLSRPVSSPAQAVQLLGTETIKGLVLTIGVFGAYGGKEAVEGTAAELSEHSLKVAEIAVNIAKQEQASRDETNDAFTAGLLHDAGKLVLAYQAPSTYQEVQRLAASEGISHCAAEAKLIGSTHAAIGAYLFGLWGLPQSIIEAVALHHSPALSSDKSFSPLTAVVAANSLVNELAGQNRDELDDATEEYFTKLGLQDRLDHWRSQCMLTSV